MNTFQKSIRESQEGAKLGISKKSLAVAAFVLSVGMSVANAQENSSVMTPDQFQFSPALTTYLTKHPGVTRESLLNRRRDTNFTKVITNDNTLSDEEAKILYAEIIRFRNAMKPYQAQLAKNDQEETRRKNRQAFFEQADNNGDTYSLVETANKNGL